MPDPHITNLYSSGATESELVIPAQWLNLAVFLPIYSRLVVQYELDTRVSPSSSQNIHIKIFAIFGFEFS